MRRSGIRIRSEIAEAEAADVTRRSSEEVTTGMAESAIGNFPGKKAREFVYKQMHVTSHAARLVDLWASATSEQ